MININRILDKAIEKDASDIHFIVENKPMIRIARNLIPIEESDILTQEDLLEIYDYLIKGNIEADKVFQETKRLDTVYEYANHRFRVNISMAEDIPVVTIRIIKKELPSYESLGIPDIVRKMTYQQQGLILVTGKTNSGKTTTLNVLINEINENQNKKIITLENPIEYKHHSKKSLIVQKEVGIGKDILSFHDGVRNSFKEDCDILVIGEIKDRITMQEAMEMSESGHLVIGTLHTSSCAETLDKIINFYEIKEQAQIRYMLSSILKLIISQRLLQGSDGKFVLVPEIIVVDNAISGMIRKEKISISEIEDAMQNGVDKGSIGLINSLAKLFVKEKITLDQAKSQIEEKDIEILNRTIMQLKIKKNGDM